MKILTIRLREEDAQTIEYLKARFCTGWANKALLMAAHSFRRHEELLSKQTQTIINLRAEIARLKQEQKTDD